MEGLLVALHLSDEQTVRPTLRRRVRKLWRALKDLVEVQSGERSAVVQQMTGGDIGIGDTMVDVDQHQRHGRILCHGVEQQLALNQVCTLFPKRPSEIVVCLEQ